MRLPPALRGVPPHVAPARTRRRRRGNWSCVVLDDESLEELARQPFFFLLKPPPKKRQQKDAVGEEVGRKRVEKEGNFFQLLSTKTPGSFEMVLTAWREKRPIRDPTDADDSNVPLMLLWQP